MPEATPVAPRPASPRTVLEERLALARNNLSVSSKTAEGDRTALREVLTQLRNQAGTFAAGLSEARAGAVETRQALKKLLVSIDHLPGDAPLRLKAGRLKPLESSSFLKNCTGYGAARRSRQAQVLNLRHGTNSADGLRGLAVERAREDCAIVSAYFQVNAKALLQPAMKAAEAQGAAICGRAASNTGLDAYTGDVLELMREAALESVRSGPGAADVAGWFNRYCDSLKKEHASQLSSRASGLQAEIRDIRAALREHDREQRIQRRAGALQGRVPASREARESAMRGLQQTLDALMDGSHFASAWATNKGSQAINGMCRGTCDDASGKRIIREIEERHGDDTFCKGAKSARVALRDYVDALDVHTVNNIARVNQELALIRFAQGDGVRTDYRRATHSAAMLDILKQMAGTAQLLKLQQFLSTAGDPQATLKYPVGGNPGHRVDFEITGFSSIPIHSPYAFRGEQGGECVYTHLAGFVVDAVEERSEGYFVRLREAAATPQQLEKARVLLR